MSIIWSNLITNIISMSSKTKIIFEKRKSPLDILFTKRTLFKINIRKSIYLLGRSNMNIFGNGNQILMMD